MNRKKEEFKKAIRTKPENTLTSKILAGDESAAARLISMIENGDQKAYQEIPELFIHSGRAHLIGITGPPGSGKSTIAGRLGEIMSGIGEKVAIIAVDPSCMNGGGALLIDRARMSASGGNSAPYIRSMADRGIPGGICNAVRGAEYVLETLGKQVIIVESVGAGQSDRNIYLVADTVITIFTPDYGDGYQLLKAGLLEIGDIIVLNKSDHAGSDNALNILSAFIQSRKSGDWAVPVICAEAVNGKGIDLLLNAIRQHKQFLDTHSKRRGKKDDQLTLFLLKEELWKHFEQKFQTNPKVMKILNDVRDTKIDPYSAVQQLLKILEV